MSKEIKSGVINYHASVNDTWLAPYVGFPATLTKKGNNYQLNLNGEIYNNVGGTYTASNGWNYRVKKLIS